MTLTREQLTKLAMEAGFKDSDVPIAVAVAMAESGGNPRAHNSKPPDNSYGLWQINMIGKLGPDRRRAFGLKNNEELFNPQVNARAAKQVHASQGWKGWTTYTSGQYKKFLKVDASLIDKLRLAGVAVGGIGGIPGAVGGIVGGGATLAEGAKEGVQGVAGAVQSIPDAITGVGRNLFKAAANLQGIAMALGFVLVGIIILMRGQIGGVVKTAKVARKVVK